MIAEDLLIFLSSWPILETFCWSNVFLCGKAWASALILLGRGDLVFRFILRLVDRRYKHNQLWAGTFE